MYVTWSNVNIYNRWLEKKLFKNHNVKIKLSLDIVITKYNFVEHL